MVRLAREIGYLSIDHDIMIGEALTRQDRLFECHDRVDRCSKMLWLPCYVYV